jgi:hypothetical protein
MPSVFRQEVIWRGLIVHELYLCRIHPDPWGRKRLVSPFLVAAGRRRVESDAERLHLFG